MYVSSPKDDLLKRHSIFQGNQITTPQDYLIRFLENLWSKIIFYQISYYQIMKTIPVLILRSVFENLRSVYENFEKCF